MIELISKGVYSIARNCPTIHLMFGYNSVWEIKTTQFYWILENIVKELEETNKQNR